MILLGWVVLDLPVISSSFLSNFSEVFYKETVLQFVKPLLFLSLSKACTLPFLIPIPHPLAPLPSVRHISSCCDIPGSQVPEGKP